MQTCLVPLTGYRAMDESDDEELMLLLELLSDDEYPVTEVLQYTEYHDMQDWEDGTGRWDRKPYSARHALVAHTGPQISLNRAYPAYFRLRYDLLNHLLLK